MTGIASDAVHRATPRRCRTSALDEPLPPVCDVEVSPAPAAPTQAAQVADPAPVLSGGPLACLPWGLTCPRTILLMR